MKKFSSIQRFSFTLLFAFALIAMNVIASDSVVDAARLNHEPISLTEHFGIFEDKSGSMTLEDIRKADATGGFKTGHAKADSLALGFSDSAFWLRLRVKNSSSDALRTMLEIAIARHGSVQFHEQADVDNFKSVDTGYFRPFAERPYKHRYFVFPMSLEPNAEKLVYLRFQGPDGMDIPAFLWGRDAFHSYERGDYITQAGYFGLVLAMGTFNLLLFFALRDFSYLLYVLFVGFVALNIAAANGLGVEYFWGNSPYWASIATLIFAIAALASMLAFARRILETRTQTPRLDQLLKWALWLQLVLIVGLLAAFKVFLQPTLFLMPVSVLLIMATAIVIAFKRQRSALFFIAAFAVLCFAVIMAVMRSFGYLPVNSITNNVVQFGSAVEMLLLAFALADRYNMMRTDKVKAQAEALKAQTEALEAEQRVVETLRSSERLLEQRVEQRTIDLSKSNAALEGTLHDLKAAQVQLVQSEKMAALGQLIAGVAHEINNPIGAVKTSGRNIADGLNQSLTTMPKLFKTLDPACLKLFLKLTALGNSQTNLMSSREERAIVRETTRILEEAGLPDARHKADVLVQLHAHEAPLDYLPLLNHPESSLILETAQNIGKVVSNTVNINTAVDRVGKIVFALKSFSRVSHDGEMVDANLQDGLETVLTIYQHQIRRGTELVRDFESIPTIRCFPDELNQVWTNLIHNALQAMNHKGTLTLGIRKIGDEAVVSVGDTGCGIPDEIRDKVFLAFFTTKPAGEGSGIGLDIVKKIIDQHHGRIEIQSKVGVGTTFSVHLPYKLT